MVILYDIYGNEYPVSDTDATEPTMKDIPKLFFYGTLPTSKDDGDLPFRIEYRSLTNEWNGYATLKVQGNTSASFPKKNFTLKLYSDSAMSKKMKVQFKDWGKQNKYVIKANWIDIMHCRNVVGARLWTQIQQTRISSLPEKLQQAPRLGAVDGFPIKVYVNGIYQGRYSMNIPKDKWTFNMDDELNTNVALCGESNEPNTPSVFAVSSDNIDGTYWSDEIHDEAPTEVISAFNRVLKFVNECTDSEFSANVSNYIDLGSLIDYWIFHVCAGNTDAYGKNQLWLTYDLTHWFISSYDMDQFWGLNALGVLAYAPDNDHPIIVAQRNNLIKKLIKNFGSEITARYTVLRQSVLSEGNIIAEIEKWIDICPPELVKEDYAVTTAGGAFTEIPTKDDENNVQQLRAWVKNRLALMDTLVPNFGVEV